jgi:alanine dehydrogenase
MNIGIPKENRPFEYRVGLSPAGVETLAGDGHTVFVEHDAGVGAGFPDQEYERAGAQIVYSSHEAFGRAGLVLKISRPLQQELEWLPQGAVIMGMLHLASAPQERIDTLLKNDITSLAYEQIQLPDGSLPVLRPFSQIGGQMSAQIAARLLQNNWGGKGILLGGIAGVPPAEVVVIGAGTVGTHATRAFLGLGAHLTVLDNDLQALQQIYDRFPQILTMVSTPRNVERACAYADVVIGAVLVLGERAPIVLTREMLKKMKPRALVMDLSIDQGGCFETSHPTLHDQPTFVEQGITHYCVPNIPGVVARTATHAFVNAAMPYISKVANLGVDKALAQDSAIELALNTHKGRQFHLQRWLTAQEGD